MSGVYELHFDQDVQRNNMILVEALTSTSGNMYQMPEESKNQLPSPRINCGFSTWKQIC